MMGYLSDLGERCGEEGREKGEKMVVVVVEEKEAMESSSSCSSNSRRVGKWHLFVGGTWEEDSGGEEGRQCLEYEDLRRGVTE